MMIQIKIVFSFLCILATSLGSTFAQASSDEKPIYLAVTCKDHAGNTIFGPLKELSRLSESVWYKASTLIETKKSSIVSYAGGFRIEGLKYELSSKEIVGASKETQATKPDIQILNPISLHCASGKIEYYNDPLDYK